MDQIKEILERLEYREKELLKLKKEKQQALQDKPEGFLRIISHGNNPQYYHRLDPKDFNGTYLKREEYQLSHILAQKEYDQKVFCAVDKELNAIQRFLKAYPRTSCAEHIYDKLHVERQKLITPIRETDEQYVKSWKSVTYEGKGFQDNIPEFYTENGERVRSKSELIIANSLNRQGIPYRYECPLYLNGVGRIHPDFTVLNTRLRKELFWEHLGMMDDPTYAEQALKKIAMYEQNNIFIGDRLIITYETRKTPLSQKQITRMIQKYLI